MKKLSILDRNARVFALLEAAAASGARCPQAFELGQGGAGQVSILAHSGKIKVEVFAKNWRVVTILEGSHKGKKTAPPPFKNHGPYLVLDSDGTHKNTSVMRRLAANSATACL